MSLKDYISELPGKLTIAIAAVGAAVTALVAVLTTGAVAAAVGAVWAAVIVVYNIVRNKEPDPPVT